MTVATNKANGVESFSLVLSALPPTLLFAVVKEEEAAHLPGGLDPSTAEWSALQRAWAGILSWGPCYSGGSPVGLRRGSNRVFSTPVFSLTLLILQSFFFFF